MRKLIAFLEEKFVPVAGRIGSQRHLVAIRDGFVAIMPLIIVGSMAVLINNLPIAAYQNFMTSVFGENWKSLGGNVWNGSFAVMSFLVVYSISHNLARSYNADPLAAGLVALACLLTITQPAAETWAIPYAWTGSLGLFVAILVAIISTEIFARLMGNRRLVVKMPEGVPPAVSKSFAALLPAVITITVFAFVKALAAAAGVQNIHQAIYRLIQSPLTTMANTAGSAMAIAFLNHFLWFFGLHGANILEPVMQTVYLPALEANARAFASGLVPPNIVTKPFFDAFVYMGGCGTTLSLIIAFYIASKRKHHRNLSSMSLPAGLFNINEPMVFGLPIVLNPVFFIPFILTPVVLTLVSYLAIAIGIVPRTVAMIPWTTPPIIGGFLATGSIVGSLLQIVNMSIGVLLYMPFVIVAERIEARKADRA